MPRRRRNPEASTLYFGAGAVLLAAAAAYLWWQKSTADALALAPASAPAPAPARAPLALPRWEPSRSRQSGTTSTDILVSSADGSLRSVSKAEADRLVASGGYFWNALRTNLIERVASTSKGMSFAGG
jgi:hypothetical protein